MKEAKKPLPPKCGNTLTPTKAPDEILSSLLRLNNYDSFSSIKDESLDIDLSACVTINAGDSAPGLNGNSFSSTDFWRMLDENAQTPQLELTLSALSDESMSKMSDSGALDPQPHHSTRVTTTPMTMTTTPVKTSSSSSSSSSVIKIDNFNVSFGDKFIRPNPPVSLHSIMPMRKTPVKVSAAQQSNEPIDQRILNSIPKELTITRVMVEPIKLHDIKMEPIEVLPDILVDEEKYNAEQLMLAEQQQEQMVNDEGLSLYKCVDCDGLMLRKQDLSKHELAAHRLLLLCSICMREFEQEAGLKKHLKTHRSNETRKDTWRKCPDCGKCLKLGSMWMHRKIHSDNKKYGCDICGQKFVQKINLTHHSRVHTAEKPYECPECQKRFQERSHLQRHQKYHAQTRSYRCEKCGKMYKTERCLKVHNLVHLEQRPFACNVCDKSFISNSKLKQHSNIHTGERPFKCNYCPRDFTNFPNWLKHTRRRHKVDHKTGQQLENIPSYCSKKSTKTTKAAKANTPNSDDTSNNISKPKLCSSSNKAAAAAVSSGSSGGTAVAEVATNNVKNSTESSTSTYLLLQQRSNDSNKLKSTTTPTILAPPTIKIQQNSSQKPQENMQINNATSSTINVKPAKAKRERKQSTPRQVQKPPKAANVTVNVTTLSTSSAINISTTTAIKKEPTNSPPSSKHAKQSDFPDLHGLSLTSAEELIMEQALEMEECGLYDAPINIGGGDTDNAISAEAAAALQFKIKSEFNDNGGGCNEEFISLKEPNNRLLCSSLESSPYSSPASVELTATTTKLPSVSPTSNAAAPLTTTYYMQPFALNAAQQGTVLARLCTTNNNLSNVVVDSSTMQLIPQILTQSHNQQTTNALPPTTQALINQFFLPMTVNIHHHQQQQQQQQQSSSKQTLPSVETLLFSAAAHTNGASSIFSTDKSTNNATQSTTSSAALAIQRNLS